MYLLRTEANTNASRGHRLWLRCRAASGKRRLIVHRKNASNRTAQHGWLPVGHACQTNNKKNLFDAFPRTVPQPPDAGNTHGIARGRASNPLAKGWLRILFCATAYVSTWRSAYLEHEPQTMPRVKGRSQAKFSLITEHRGRPLRLATDAM